MSSVPAAVSFGSVAITTYATKALRHHALQRERCQNYARMDHHLFRLACMLHAAIVLTSSGPTAQSTAPIGPPAKLLSLKNFLPLGPPAGLKPSSVPDLSGAWVRGGPLQSISNTDVGGELRGKEPDVPYQPWALKRMLSEISLQPAPSRNRTGQPIRGRFNCEPNGPVRVYAHPGRTAFVQLPDRVLMLHEIMQQFRIVRLNSTHPPLEDLDPSWWGDSIGGYENGDTLVVDTIGTNGRAWLSQQGHPSTEKLHLIERYRRVDAKTLDFDVTVDDPGAYTKPFMSHRSLRLSTVPFMQSPWNCSVRDNMTFIERLLTDAAPPSK